TTLISIQIHEAKAVLTFHLETHRTPSLIACVRRLNLDDIRAHIAQEHCAVGACHYLGEIKYPQLGQGLSGKRSLWTVHIVPHKVSIGLSRYCRIVLSDMSLLHGEPITISRRSLADFWMAKHASSVSRANSPLWIGALRSRTAAQSSSRTQSRPA